MSHFTSDSAFRSVLQRICERIDSARAAELYEGIGCNNPPPKYFPAADALNATDFATEYFISKILSKWKGWRGKAEESKKAALAGWESDEFLNLLTNRRLLGLVQGTGYPGSDLIRIITISQGHIARVLGRFRLQKVLDGCRWGPGATEDLPRSSTQDTKISGRMSSTREALPFMKLLIESDPNWGEAITGFYPSGPFSICKDFWKITDSSRFTTVPKDWDKDRCIDMQPTANGYLQQGVGRYIRSRLRSEGIDLNSQEVNQEMAFYAYFSGLATVDLQSASDSVTYQLVSLLLPPDWCQYLCSLRTKYTQFGRRGPKVKTEKFSAMGNAFTFELETLIFWAISLACTEEEGVKDGIVVVYGDDIVVNSAVYDRLVHALNYFGFRVNESKSFRSGPFYESCGRHYHTGIDVTPVYQKSVVNSPEECIRFHNRLVRWGERIHGDPWYFLEALTLLHAMYYDTCPNAYMRGKDLPRISLTTEGDDGFLSEDRFFERDVNGGYSTVVLRRRNVLRVNGLNEAAYLQTKLNHVREHAELFQRSSTCESCLMGHPKGWPAEPVEHAGRYKLSQAYFYR
jgi:hypothetical protein